MTPFYIRVIAFLFMAVTLIDGITRMSKGRDNGISLLDVICDTGFALCIGLFFRMSSPIWIVPGVLFWGVAHFRQEERAKQQSRQLAELRAVNGADNPEFLREPPLTCPPEQLPYRPGFRVFNNETGELIGTITRVQLQGLIRCGYEFFDRSNDIWVPYFYLLDLEEKGVGADLVALLREHMDENDDVELRWTL